jgi:hypothetical protein
MTQIMPHRITGADVVLAVVLALVGVYLVAFAGPSGQGGEVVITAPGQAPLTLSLSENRTLVVSGLRGETVIEVSRGAVRFAASACPHRICLRRGAISRRGEWIACVPNGVFARVTGEGGELGEERYDRITP